MPISLSVLFGFAILFVVAIVYCAARLGGRADDQIDRWLAADDTQPVDVRADRASGSVATHGRGYWTNDRHMQQVRADLARSLPERRAEAARALERGKARVDAIKATTKAGK